MRAAAVASVCLAVLFVSGPGVAQTERPEWLARLDTWSRAVDTHTPGERDDAVIELAAWAYDDVRQVVSDYQEMQTVMRRAWRRGLSFEIELRKSRITTEDLRKMSVFREQTPEEHNRTRRRAAMLHADVALLAPLDWSRSTGPPDSAKVLDGIIVGYEGQSVHWVVGRALLDGITPSPAEDRFVSLWYHAVAAALLEDGNLAGAKPHLEHAFDVLPKDPQVHYESGYYHQASAAPSIAAVTRMQANTSRLFGSSRRFGLDPGESQESHARDAQRRFREAVALDPTHVEARMRLGRELLEAGRVDEAASHLRQASIEADEPVLTYLALMLTGQAEERLGRRTEAEACYTRAAGMFPEAQSPRLAKAALARSAGSRDAAWRLVRDGASDAMPPTADADPWWAFFRWQRWSSTVLLRNLREMSRAENPR